MQPQSWHPKLAEQLQVAFGAGVTPPENLQSFITAINETYISNDTASKDQEAKIALRTEQLLASTSRAYSFLDSLNMGLMITDVNPEVVLTNQPLQKMLSSKLHTTIQTPAPAPGTEWSLEVISGLLKPEIDLIPLIKQSLETNKPIECSEVTVGSFILRWFIAPMINEVSPGDKQQIGAVVLVEDITEQKNLERSKDEFLSIASHELRTPLTAIRGNSAIIKKYYAKSIADESVTEMVEDIHESAVRLIEIVNDFLDVSALEQGKIQIHPEAFSIYDVASEVMRELQNVAAEKGIALVIDETTKNMPNVTADRQRIKQVIYNLVGNASKFTEKGSITISGANDGKFVYTYVTDTGRGMSAESQRLLFRKFQQAGSSLLTRDTTKGTGLGLYISKLIIELSGGNITLAKSVVGQGSTFVFSLPNSVDNKTQSPPQPTIQ